MSRMLSLLALAVVAADVAALDGTKVHDMHHHHHHHHHKGHHQKDGTTQSAAGPSNGTLRMVMPAAPARPGAPASHSQPVAESKLTMDQVTLAAAAAKQSDDHEVQTAATKNQGDNPEQAELELNAPLPADFAKVFAQEVGKATGVDPKKVRILHTAEDPSQAGVDEVVFEAPLSIANAVEEQATDPASKLSTGALRIFLLARDSTAEEHAPAEAAPGHAAPSPPVEKTEEAEEGDASTPVKDNGIDVDTAMPYGELEPFGREDTAQELTGASIKESDEMVDQLERAEVAEEKRAVFRALTRLRGAAITSYDGVARSQTGNIDEYNRKNHWRSTHPLHHLAQDESDVAKWAFPDNGDF